MEDNVNDALIVQGPRTWTEFQAKLQETAARLRDRFGTPPIIEGGKFTTLPNEVRDRIFEFVLLARGDTHLDVCPFYPTDYHLDHGLFSQGERIAINLRTPPVWQRPHPRVDLNAFGINEEYGNICIKMYFSRHDFLFNDARSCLLFFRTIGLKAIKSMASATFNLSSGYFFDKANRVDSDPCEERRWCDFFAFLRPRQKFLFCRIRFCDWKDLRAREDLTVANKTDMTRARLDLVATLASFREVGQVDLSHRGCAYLGGAELRGLQQAMSSSGAELPLGCHDLEVPMYERSFWSDLVVGHALQGRLGEAQATDEIGARVGSLQIGEEEEEEVEMGEEEEVMEEDDDDDDDEDEEEEEVVEEDDDEDGDWEGWE